MRRTSISLVASLLVVFLGAAQSQRSNAPYKNPALSVDEGVKDLLGRMPLMPTWLMPPESSTCRRPRCF